MNERLNDLKKKEINCIFPNGGVGFSGSHWALVSEELALLVLKVADP